MSIQNNIKTGLLAEIVVTDANGSFVGINTGSSNNNLGSNSNVHITGGTNGQALITDGNGNLHWGVVGGIPAGSDRQIQFNANGVFGGSSALSLSQDNVLQLANNVLPNINPALLSIEAVSTNASFGIDGNNGFVDIFAGNNSTAVDMYIYTADSASGNSGDLFLNAGGVTGSHIPGSVFVYGGIAGDNGTGGGINIIAGNGFNGSSSGGPVTIQGGGSNQSVGGNVDISGGGGNNGRGGSVDISGGSAGGNYPAVAGDVNITSGDGNPYGKSGNVNISVGQSGASGVGNINFNGTVNLGAVSTVHITGGSNNRVLTTDGAGNLSYAGSIKYSGIYVLPNEVSAVSGPNSVDMPGNEVAWFPVGSIWQFSGDVDNNDFTVASASLVGGITTRITFVENFASSYTPVVGDRFISATNGVIGADYITTGSGVRFVANPTVNILELDVSLPNAGASKQLLFTDYNTFGSTSGLEWIPSSNTLSVPGNISYTRTHGQFYSNTTQTNTSANTPLSLTYNNVDSITNHNVTVSNNSHINISSNGAFNIQFSAQVDRTTSGTSIAYFWLSKNGVDIPWSSTALTISGNASQNPVVAAWNWLVQSSGSDYFEIKWASTDVNIEIQSNATPPVGPAVPSVILTVTEA